VNITAIPDGLYEATLFGYKKGAFTGASEDTPGVLEAAGRGCLIIDEIGDLPVSMQAKLNRALLEREYSRLGETSIRHVEARIISSTNKPLESYVKQEKFRHDLLQRLRGFTVTVPSLEERKADIPDLANYFLQKNMDIEMRPFLKYSHDAIAFLAHHDWSDGNVRSLEQVIVRAVVAAPRRLIDPEVLETAIKEELGQATPPKEREISSTNLKEEYNLQIEEVKARFRGKVEKTITECNGDERKARKLLQLTSNQWYDLRRRKRRTAPKVEP
jgi:transcriptional regulator with PAS, ATPase and Fis domain